MGISTIMMLFTLVRYLLGYLWNIARGKPTKGTGKTARILAIILIIIVPIASWSTNQAIIWQDAFKKVELRLKQKSEQLKALEETNHTLMKFLENTKTIPQGKPNKNIPSKNKPKENTKGKPNTKLSKKR